MPSSNLFAPQTDYEGLDRLIVSRLDKEVAGNLFS